MSKSSLPSIIDLLLLPLRGGDNEDGNEGGDSSQGNSGGDSNDDGHNSEDEDEDDLSGITDPRDRRIAELSREAARHRREKNANKKALEKLQADMDAIKNAGGDQEKQWESEKRQFEEKYNELLTNTSNAILRNAVASPENKYSWYDVPVVMGLINREAIDIDLDEGVVDGLDVELKRIAKEKPYLVKKAPASGGTSGNGNNGNGTGSGSAGPTGRTGSNPSGRDSSNDAKAAQRATLEGKYPGLNF